MNARTALVLTLTLLYSRPVSAQIGNIYTFAGNDQGSIPGNGGPATSAIITNPGGLDIDLAGNLYIAASGNSLIRQVNVNTGIITTVAGGGTGGDGGLATAAQLSNPCDVKLDPWHNLYFSETCIVASGGGGGSGTGGIARIRRVDAQTGILTTIAGGTTSGFAGDGGPAASALLNTPTGLAIDSSGNIFIADSGNNRIRRIDRTTGYISTVAGNGYGLFAGDGGTAMLASLNSPAGLAIDANGNLYIADTMNNVIRRVDAVTGIISTIAGTGATAFNGDGIAATTANLNEPASVIFDSGNLVLAELGNNRVRTIDSSGLIWTLVGNGSASGTQIGDGGQASLAVLSHPFGLAGLPSEPLYISELTGDRVRIDGLPSSVAATAVALSSSAATSPYGTPVTLTASLTAYNGLASSAIGGVYFVDGTSTFVGSAAVVNGSATFTTSSLALGVHNISAQFTGSSSFGGSFSPSIAVTIGAPATTVLLNVSPNPPAVNQAVSLTAFLSPSTATGTVYFYNGTTTLLGSAGISGGAATLNLAGLAVGTYSLTAQYPGDSSHSAAVSQPVSIIVKASSSIVVTSSLNPSTAGQSVTFTAALSPASATGTVQFLDGGAQLGAATIVSGTASFSTSSLASGQHSITASYSGDTNYLSSNSPALTQTVNAALSTTTTTLQSSQNPLLAGGSVTFTASVSPATATGTVQFLNGAAVIGTGTLFGGTTSSSTSALAVGTYAITAAYSGDISNAASTSAVLSQAVRILAGFSTTITPSTVVAGQTVTITANLNTAATGTVKFSDGTTVLATVPVAAGTASYSGSFTQGLHMITATYSGDGTYMSASSSTNQPVLAASSVALTTSLSPSTQGQSVAFTASVAPSAATGTVQFLDGGTVIGTAPLISGVAVFSTAALAVGSHSITAAYGGDASDSTASSAPLSQVVKTVAGVSVSSSPNPAFVGQSITITATVTPSTATGTIQFLDGASVLGTAPVNSGSAVLNTSALTQGTHILTAAYSGDANNAPASSPGITQTVNAKAATTTVVTSSINPSALGNPVEFAATVSAGTGSVQFFDGATSLGTASLVGTTAELVTSALTQGSHSITAVYAGDAANASSTSAVFTQIVKLNANLNLLTSLDPSVIGQTVTFTATLSAGATGTVQFLDGNTAIGTATVSGGSAIFSTSSLAQGSHIMSASYSGDSNYLNLVSVGITQTVNAKTSTVATVASASNPAFVGAAVTFTAGVSPATATGAVQFLDGATVLGSATLANGMTSFTTSNLAQGTHSITAVYAGDPVDSGSTSAALAQVMKLSAGLSVGLSPSPAVQGQTVRITANMSSAATGTVQFTDNGSVVATVPVAVGTASFSTSSLALGSHTLGIAYSGDATYMSASTVVPETVIAASTVVVGSNANPSLVGQSVTFTASVTPATATGTVQFYDGGNLIGAASLASGNASIATASLAKGAHSISAVYGGDAMDAAAGSATLNQIVKALASVSLASSVNPSTVGQAVSFSASVIPSAAIGTVQFVDGSTVLGTVNVSSGNAAFSTSSLAAGGHSITAYYSGDSYDTAATSAVLTQMVNAPAPAAPSNLNANASGSTQINLNWHASPTSGVTYNVYGSTSAGFTPSAANRLATGVASTSYSATGLSFSTTYYFRVTAALGGGESAATNQANATTASAFACHVTYSVTTQWNDGFGTAISIQNTGTAGINSWKLTWTWPGNQALSQSWNATYQQSGPNVTLTNESYNKQIAAGATVSGVGFNASYSGSNPAPAAFYVNGTLCH